jgi:hypothetical protein
MSGSLGEAVRRILDPRLLQPGPALTLAESAPGSRCAPVTLRSQRPAFALRIESDKHLPLLAALPDPESVRKLPDYVVFREPDETPTRKEDTALHAIVCELKSSETGALAASRQVQLGKLLVEYLARIAAYAEGKSEAPKLYLCGLIVSPDVPPNLRPKGTTRPGKVEHFSTYDKLAAIKIYRVTGGASVHAEDFF